MKKAPHKVELFDNTLLKHAQTSAAGQGFGLSIQSSYVNHRRVLSKDQLPRTLGQKHICKGYQRISSSSARPFRQMESTPDSSTQTDGPQLSGLRHECLLQRPPRPKRTGGDPRTLPGTEPISRGGLWTRGGGHRTFLRRGVRGRAAGPGRKMKEGVQAWTLSTQHEREQG